VPSRFPGGSFLAVALLAASMAHAQTASDAERRRDEARERIEAVETERRAAAQRRQRVEAEIETIRRDRAELARRLVESGQRARQIEQQVAAAERRLFELEAERGRVRGSLVERRAAVAELLAALQRLGRNPPPALFVEPDNALAAIRSAILMGAVLPGLRVEVETLVADLERLSRLGRLVETETERLKTELAGLAEARELIQALSAARQREQTASEDELTRTRARLDTLARDARTTCISAPKPRSRPRAARRRRPPEPRRSASRRSGASRSSARSRPCDARTRSGAPSRACPTPGACSRRSRSSARAGCCRFRSRASACAASATPTGPAAPCAG
jgi:murein hydrolase activator